MLKAEKVVAISIWLSVLGACAFLLGAFSVKPHTGVIIPQEPASVSTYSKLPLNIRVSADDGDAMVVTGYNAGTGQIKVFVKNASERARQSVQVCWKEIDKDGVVINKECGTAEEDPVDPGDITDSINEVKFKDRTVGLVLFVVSHPYRRDTHP